MAMRTLREGGGCGQALYCLAMWCSPVAFGCVQKITSRHPFALSPESYSQACAFRGRTAMQGISGVHYSKHVHVPRCILHVSKRANGRRSLTGVLVVLHYRRVTILRADLFACEVLHTRSLAPAQT